MSLDNLVRMLKGGAGSGNFGHGGRPGKRGGSTPGGRNLAFPIIEPRSIKGQGELSYVRNLHVKDLLSKLDGKDSPGGITGAYQSGLSSSSFATKKSPKDVKKVLEQEGWVKSGGAYYMLSKNTGTGTKATISITQHKPSFYAQPEDWTVVEFSGVVQR